VIVRSIYQNVILAPCRTLTESQADRIVEALHEVLFTTSEDGRPCALFSSGSGEKVIPFGSRPTLTCATRAP